MTTTSAIVTVSDKFWATNIGLSINPDATYEEWEAYGKKLGRVYSGLQWQIGDWINFGEAKFGEMYAQAENDTDLSYGTLRNYASVCARIPAGNRRKELLFHQTKHVACLEWGEQLKVINAAIAGEWTGTQVLEAVQRITGKKTSAASITGAW